jgi:hypothetical protein
MTYETTQPIFPALPLVPCPVWGSAARIEELTGLKATQLAKLVTAGHVRRRKLGDSTQADALYRVLDVIEFLDGSESFPAARTATTETLPPVATSQG